MPETVGPLANREEPRTLGWLERAHVRGEGLMVDEQGTGERWHGEEIAHHFDRGRIGEVTGVARE